MLTETNKPYLTVAETLRNRVLSGTLPPGRKIGSQHELAAEFNVAPATIQKAINELEREGFIWCEQGRGRYVADFKQHQRTWTIGVILADLRHLVHPVASQRLTGIKDVIGAAGYHLTTFAMNGDAKDADRWMEGLDTTRIDGAIIIAQEPGRQTIPHLAHDVPSVWMDAPFGGERLASVNLDYMGGGFAAARHLLDLGHRRIVFLCPSLDAYRISRAQHEGIRLAVEQTGTSGARVTCFETVSYSAEEAQRVVSGMLRHDARPTALICASDEMARGAWQACAEAGVAIPRDLSLIAWNDTIRADEISLPLTTVRMDFRLAGEKSARLLLRMIEETGMPPQAERLPAELVVRKSTVPPVRTN